MRKKCEKWDRICQIKLKNYTYRRLKNWNILPIKYVILQKKDNNEK